MRFWHYLLIQYAKNCFLEDLERCDIYMLFGTKNEVGVEVTPLTFGSHDGKTTLAGFEIKSENPTSGRHLGVVTVLHGIGEHMRRRKKLIMKLVAAGYIVIVYDCLGHGQSVKDKEMYISKLDDVVNDFLMVANYGFKKYRGIPCFALGFSLGSFVLRVAMTAKYYDKYSAKAGAILVGTGWLEPLVAQLMMGVVHAIGVMNGGCDKVSGIVNNMAFNTYNQQVNGNDPADWLYQDQKAKAEYMTDPSVRHFVTPGLFRELLRAMKIANCSKEVRDSQKIPILILSGEEDPVGGFGKGIQKVHRLFVNGGFDDVTIEICRGRHDVLSDVDSKKACEAVLSWLNEKTADRFKGGTTK